MTQQFYPFSNYEFFRPENIERYEAFKEVRPELTTEEVVIYVNMHLDREFYSYVYYVDDPLDILTMVNKFYRMESGFSPYDLTWISAGRYLREEAAEHFLAMEASLLYDTGLGLIHTSSYRSYTHQTNIFNNNLAAMGREWTEMWNARPGHSEHQLGLAIDIIHSGGSTLSLTGANFQYTEQYGWLLDNAYRYGFIYRYPLDFIYVTGYNHEPWHWRYVGIELSTYMRDNEIPTLEHYFATRPTDHPYGPVEKDNYAHLLLSYEDDNEGYVIETGYDLLTIVPTQEDESSVFWYYIAILIFAVTVLVLLTIRLVNINRRKRRRNNRRNSRQNSGRNTYKTYRN